jgi:hypothetical protein
MLFTENAFARISAAKTLAPKLFEKGRRADPVGKRSEPSSVPPTKALSCLRRVDVFRVVDHAVNVLLVIQLVDADFNPYFCAIKRVNRSRTVSISTLKLVLC